MSFEPQPQAIKLDVQHLPSAYVGETFPISVKVSSEDDRDIEVQLAVFLQPGGEDNDASTIRVDDQESKSLLNGISLGKVAAGASVERVVHLKPLSAGPRVIDLSLSTTTPKGSTEEMTRTVTIPVVPPFVCVSTVVYRNAGTKGGEATVRTLLKANGPSDLLVDSLALKTQVRRVWSGCEARADGRMTANNTCWRHRWTLQVFPNVSASAQPVAKSRLDTGYKIRDTRPIPSGAIAQAQSQRSPAPTGPPRLRVENRKRGDHHRDDYTAAGAHTAHQRIVHLRFVDRPSPG